MTPRNILIAAVALFAIAFGAWTSYRLATPPPTPRTATVLPAPDPLPEFSLVDQDGEAVDRELFVGQWDLVFFGFTHCPDVCPITMKVLADARRQLAEEGHRPLPRIVFVSVDPGRDTPKLLREYVRYFGPDVVGLTGSLDELRRLTGPLGVYFEKSGSGDDYSVDHSAFVLVVNPAGEFGALFSSPHEADNFVHDLPIIMGQA